MTQRAGDAIRGRIDVALLAAGPAGATCAEIADKVCEAERNARWYLSTSVGLAYKAATKSHAQTRWYHPTFAAQADAYVAECDARGRSKARAGTALILQTISAAVDGKTLPEIAEAIGRSVRCIREFVTGLVRDGKIQAVRWHGGATGGGHLRYWGVDQVAEQPPPKPPRVRIRVRKKAASKRKPRQEPKPHQKMKLSPKRLPSLLPARHTGQIIIPDHVKPVVIKHQEDTRFVPEKVEPFFSRPEYRTDFIGQDTWAARVYGARP